MISISNHFFSTVTLLLLFSIIISSTNVQAGWGKLLDVLIDQAKRLDFLVEKGIARETARELGQQIQRGLDTFVPQGKSLGELHTVLQTLKLDGSDVTRELRVLRRELSIDLSGAQGDFATLKKLRDLLDKPAEDIKEKDISDMTNYLLYLANRHGVANSYYTVCKYSTPATLRSVGVEHFLTEVTDSDVQRFMRSLPRTVEGRQGQIDTIMRKFEWPTEINALGAEELPINDERVLALFLNMADQLKSNRPEMLSPKMQKMQKLVAKIEELGDPLAEESQHKIYTIIASDLDEASIDGWGELVDSMIKLKSTTRKTDGSPWSNREAFFEVLRQRAENNSFKKSLLKQIKEQNCFMN